MLYAAPELTAVWRGERLRENQRKQTDPTVARFVLAGRPRPRVEDTVRIAKIMRLATMAKFGWTIIDGKRRPNAPSVISGYGGDGKPLRNVVTLTPSGFPRTPTATAKSTISSSMRRLGLMAIAARHSIL